jgi:hypothetical protein
MNEARMAMRSAMQSLISAYSSYPEPDAWKIEHDAAMLCYDVEGAGIWAVKLFEGIQEEAVRLQSHAFRGEIAPDASDWVMLNQCYRDWTGAAQRWLAVARKLVRAGYPIQGIDELQAAFDEGSSIVGNADLANELLPHEQLVAGARPQNPSPDRYGD